MLINFFNNLRSFKSWGLAWRFSSLAEQIRAACHQLVKILDQVCRQWRIGIGVLFHGRLAASRHFAQPADVRGQLNGACARSALAILASLGGKFETRRSNTGFRSVKQAGGERDGSGVVGVLVDANLKFVGALLPAEGGAPPTVRPRSGGSGFPDGRFGARVPEGRRAGQAEEFAGPLPRRFSLDNVFILVPWLLLFLLDRRADFRHDFLEQLRCTIFGHGLSAVIHHFSF